MKLDAQQALERAERKLAAYVGVCKGDKELTDTVLPMVRAALAALDGKHVYVSDYADGDAVWIIDHFDGRWRLAYRCAMDYLLAIRRNDVDCFPTRELAEAAAAKRNKERERT